MMMMMAGELSIVDRLPSNNVTFQSAQICTIPELFHLFNGTMIKSKEQPCYDTANENDNDTANDSSNNSVLEFHHPVIHARTTGLVLYTDTVNEFVLLGDAVHKPMISCSKIIKGVAAAVPLAVTTPNEKLKKTIGLSSSTNISRTPINTATNNSSNIKSLYTMKSTSLSTNTPTTNTPTTTSTPLLSGRKRKLITVKKPSHPSLLNRKSDKKKLVFRHQYTQKSVSSIINNQEPSTTATTTTTTTTTTPISVVSTPLSSSSSSSLLYTTKLKPLTSTSTSTSTSTLFDNRPNTNNTINRKLIQIIQKKQKEGMNMIIISYKNGLNDVVWKDGDLIMVIGKLVYNMKPYLDQQQKTQHDDDDNNDGNGNGEMNNETILQSILNTIYCNSNNTSATGTSRGDSNDDNSDEKGGFVNARIITNANGTDVNLLQEALKLRRKYLARIRICNNNNVT